MSTRSRKEEKQYTKYRRSIKKINDCVFCEIKKGDNEFISETKSFKVIINRFPYSHWDNQNVTDHLMIVPKKHTDTLSELTPEEALEYVKLMSAYEAKGYNVWARAPHSIRKSVIHQHTHLMKPGKKIMRFVFFVHRPYWRFMR